MSSRDNEEDGCRKLRLREGYDYNLEECLLMVSHDLVVLLYSRSCDYKLFMDSDAQQSSLEPSFVWNSKLGYTLACLLLCHTRASFHVI